MTAGQLETRAVEGPAGDVEVHTAGMGPLVVLVPSVGRGAEDFVDLAHRLAEGGYLAACPQPRGIGGSTGALRGMSMADLAADVAAVITTLVEPGARAVVAGHAFGNRVVRMVATDHPDLVAGVALLACGGAVPATPEVDQALHRVFDESLPEEEHLAAVATAFFAPGNDATVWRGGRYPAVAAAQGRANIETSADTWWSAGSAPVLVVQPADDVVAVPANAEAVVRDLGERATLVTVPQAGHALLPEQPTAVAEHLLDWLATVLPSG